MNFRRIENLLERYFDGNTSLEEERILKDFFQGEDIPPHLIALKDSFNYFSKEYNTDELDASFDQKILSQINHFDISNKRQERKRTFYYISGVAASLLIIISIFTNFNPFTNKLSETLENPEAAYQETRKALLFVSGALNKGVKPIDKMAKFEEGIEQLSKMKSLSTGMEEVEKISKFYDTQQKIINN